MCVHAVWLHRLRASPPPLHAVEIVAAQWAIETGWGQKCHCYNVGNAKGRVGGVYDWTFFKCGEELARATARAEARRDGRVVIQREYVLGGRDYASVVVLPEHPWCCFRAFESLVDGVADHLQLLHRRFGDAFTAAVAGDARAFCSCLKRAGYYTASVEQYTRGLTGCLPRVREAASRIDWAECPCLTEGQIRRVEGILALSGELGEDEWAEMVGERDRAVRESS